MLTIYLLRDPRDGKPRYVGITSLTPKKRMIQHSCAARRNPKLPVHCWMRKLLGLGLAPAIEVLEETEDRNQEVYWIERFRCENPKGMLNLLAGGSGYPSEDPRVREKLRGPKSAAHREAVSRTRRERFAAGILKGLSGDDNPMRKRPECVPRGEKNGQARLTSEDVLSMRAAFSGGATTTEIARAHGVKQAVAWRIVYGLSWAHLPGAASQRRGKGIKPPASITRGEAHHGSKVSAEQVVIIRARRAAGETTTALAREFGLSDTHILRIVRGDVWAHLPLAA